MSFRCDLCGKFAKRGYDIWNALPQDGIDYEACAECAGMAGDE